MLRKSDKSVLPQSSKAAMDAPTSTAMLAGEISQANQESSLSATAWQENSATSDFATDASRAQDYKLEQPDPPSSINQAQAGL